MRIFWLGMHRLLVHAELPQLRELGFEVFHRAYRPQAYLGRVQDQSALDHTDAKLLLPKLGWIAWIRSELALPSAISEAMRLKTCEICES